MSAERNAEIWSTRLQKELLALTTDNASAKETEDVAGILPPFISVKEHSMDISAGTCVVSFAVDVAMPNEDADNDKENEGQDEAPKEENPTEQIIVAIDASLEKKEDGSINPDAAAYPFAMPKVKLLEGASRFPPGSTISNNDFVDIDCDWTPSLHITDAVLNIGLKIKESILQKEPFHPAAPAFKNSSMSAASLLSQDPVDDIVKGARRFGSLLSKTARGVLDNAPAKKSFRRKKKTKKKATATEISIGDEINLLESPWDECRGLYTCKAIRRPAFVEDAMALALAKTKPEVAGAGFAGAAGVFRSITQSAKSVLEESFLMITESHIVELRSSKLNLSTGTVTFSIPIELMAKLKFRRQESISLFFKPAPDDPLIFMCPDSADAVHQIQNVLKTHGVKGKHTNAATQRAIHEALQLVQEIQAKERALEYQPSVERVNEIMDLYRQAAERFEVAGDVRHEEVVTHMRKFLAQPLTVSILDGSFTPTPVPQPETKDPSKVPEGEVLERTKEQLDDDDSIGDLSGKDAAADKAFEESIDNVLMEAKKDLDDLTVGDSTTEEDIIDSAFDDGDAAIADIDAMLNAADKELADIMAS